MKTYIGFAIVLMLLSCNTRNKTCNCNFYDDFTPIEGIPVFTDLDSGIDCATKCKKPILLWFTGWGNVSDHKMSEKVFVVEPNYSLLKNEYTIICLYTDDRTELSKNEIETWQVNGKLRNVKTVGDQNTKYQIERFQINSQPLFCILSSDGEDLINQFAYLPEVGKIESILTQALSDFDTKDH